MSVNHDIYRAIKQRARRPNGEGLGGYHWEVDEDALIEETIKECIECIQTTMSRDGHGTSHYLQSVGHINKIKQHFWNES